MHRIGLVIILCILAIHVGEFFGVMPEFVGVFGEVLGVGAILFLVYEVRVSRMLFGVHSKVIDLLLLLSFSILSLKDFTNVLEYSNPALDLLSVYVGAGLLLIISAVLSTKDFSSPSFMTIIKEVGSSKSSAIVRFLIVFFTLMAFYIIVFNLVLSWLALLIDMPFATVALIYYLYIVVRRHDGYPTSTFLYKVGHAGEQFYKDMIGAFSSKDKIWYGLSFLLVLHLIADGASYLLPYITGIASGSFRDVLLQHLSTHAPLLNNYLSEMVLLAPLDRLYLALVYVFNLVGLVLLFTAPMYIWYNAYKRRGFWVSSWLLTLFYFSTTVYFLMPIFEIRRLIGRYVGVDISTHVALVSNIAPSSILLIALIVGAMTYVVAKFHVLKNWCTICTILTIDVYFFAYLVLFFSSYSKYYVTAIKESLLASHFLIAGYLVLFLTAIILFYTLGYFAYVKQTIKEYKLLRE